MKVLKDRATRRLAFACACALAACLGLAACGGGQAAPTYKDGTYTGKSSVLNANVDGDGYGEIEVRVENGAITGVVYTPYQVDGTVKGADYGKDGAYYGVAQKVLESGSEYCAALVDTGDPDAVDVVSGATYMHDQFVEAAKDALKDAAE